MYKIQVHYTGVGHPREVSLFFFKQKTAYDISACLVGSVMCIRGRGAGGVGFVGRLGFRGSGFRV